MRKKTYELAEDKLSELVDTCLEALLEYSPFCLALDGSLGSGKTALTKHFLYKLGLNQQTLISSPTFNYLNEYTVSNCIYGHLDLYRLPNQPFCLVDDPLKYKGFIVEWTKNKDLSLYNLPLPTMSIEISYLEEGSSFSQKLRNYTVTYPS